jgi:SNF2 family DNA or RNA helicase
MLKWMRFHGSRKRKALSITYYDIVITTFETLVRQRKKHIDPKCLEDTIFSYSWHRVVLDEAHIIRNRTTSMAQACCAVHATSRWAITGTPIQNRVTDLGSLLEFLQVYPFSNPKLFDSEIIKPWLKSTTPDISRLKRLINCISLCRTKEIIDLPKREDEIHNLDFNPEEREYYETQKARTIQQFNDALSSSPPKPGQYLNALQWLNELRLICNHGISHSKRKQNAMLGVPQASSAWTKEVADKAFETLVCAGDAVCSVCRDILTDSTGEASSSEHSKPTLTSCLNLTCGSCIHDVTRGRSVPKCSHSPPCPSREVSWDPEAAVGQVVKFLPGIDSVETSTKLKTLMTSLCALNGEKR